MDYKHARLACPSPIPRAYSNPCPLSQWCHPIISSSVVPVSSCLQSCPASGSFQMNQFCASSGGQSIGVAASLSVLPMNIQHWFPLGWTGWISLQSKGLWRVFSIYSKPQPHLPRRPSKTLRQAWPRLLWSHYHTLARSAFEILWVPSKSGVSVLPSPVELLCLSSSKSEAPPPPDARPPGSGTSSEAQNSPSCGNTSVV